MQRRDTARGYPHHMLERTRDNPAADCLRFRKEVVVPAPKDSTTRPTTGAPPVS